MFRFLNIELRSFPVRYLLCIYGLAVCCIALLGSLSIALAADVLEGYSDYRQLTVQLEELSKGSDVAKLKSLGKTIGGRDVWLLTVGTGEVDKKPAILVVGDVEPARLVGSQLALQMAARLVKQGGKDGGKDSIKKLLSTHTFYFIPRPSPDASEKCFAKPRREPAGNGRSTDDDRDGEVGEDAPNDLNGDGLISMMRVEDPTGPYIPHPDDSRVMILADASKNERGKYRLFVEGKDDDEDESQSEDAADGVSFNRNFTFRYPYFGANAGENQVSEAETRAVADFCFDRPNIAVVFTFGFEDNLMRPWKAAGEKGPAGKLPGKAGASGEDVPYLDLLAERYQKLHGGKEAPESPTGAGSFSEWSYYHYGRWPLVARAWWPPAVKPADKPEQKPAAKTADESKTDPKKEEKPSKPEAKAEEKPPEKKPSDEKRGAEDISTLRWMAQEKIDGFVPWKAIDKHPDFPGKKVEVGGFKPLVRSNPPIGAVDELAGKHADFLLEVAERLPKLALPEVKVESLGGKIFRVTATVVNEGYLPTMSKQGETSGWVYPLQAELELPKSAVWLTGSQRTRVPVLAGSGGKHETIWLVRVADEKPVSAQVKIYAPAVGEVSKMVELK